MLCYNLLSEITMKKKGEGQPIYILVKKKKNDSSIFLIKNINNNNDNVNKFILHKPSFSFKLINTTFFVKLQ